MQSLSALFASIVAVILFTLVPAYRTYWIIDQQVYKYVNLETQELANNMRHKGYIDMEMYEGFVGDLSKTQNVYDISIIHTKKTYYPLLSTDPGYSANHMFTVVEQKYPLSAIVDQMNSDANHMYKMSRGDNVYVEVVNRSKTGTMVFLQIVGGNGESSLVSSKAGGMITNENY